MYQEEFAQQHALLREHERLANRLHQKEHEIEQANQAIENFLRRWPYRPTWQILYRYNVRRKGMAETLDWAERYRSQGNIARYNEVLETADRNFQNMNEAYKTYTRDADGVYTSHSHDAIALVWRNVVGSDWYRNKYERPIRRPPTVMINRATGDNYNRNQYVSHSKTPDPEQVFEDYMDEWYWEAKPQLEALENHKLDLISQAQAMQDAMRGIEQQLEVINNLLDNDL